MCLQQWGCPRQCGKCLRQWGNVRTSGGNVHNSGEIEYDLGNLTVPRDGHSQLCINYL